jgi:hypothetical protein
LSGYAGLAIFLTVLGSPVILLVSAAALRVARRFELFAPNVPAIVNFGLVGCSLLGLGFLGLTVDQLIVTPAIFQKDYLGARVAPPWQLRRAEIMPAMMDPWSEYRYQVGPEVAATLRRRCRPNASPGTCLLFADRDESWFAEVTLSETNELKILDGLH